jgi:serine/threonine protein kinase
MCENTKNSGSSGEKNSEQMTAPTGGHKPNPPSPNGEKQCQVVESGVDNVTFNIKLKDDILSEREKMIKAIKGYIRKHKRLPPTTLEYYKFVKLVGKGAFGKVTLGIHKLTGKKVAIKTIEKSYMKDDFSRKKVLQEVYILKNIKHSNVIRLLEVFESPKHLLIVMEYSGGGDLLKYIKKYGRLDENKAREFFIQTVYGLAHCHCRSVLHRDVKLDNILLDGDGGVKL